MDFGITDSAAMASYNPGTEQAGIIKIGEDRVLIGEDVADELGKFESSVVRSNERK